MSVDYCFAFWNLENLFDVEESPRRTEKLERAIGNDLEGWTEDLLNQKVSQLASIIGQMNGGNGPDLLGVCEVENEYVMQQLVQALAPLGRNYAVEHHDMSDSRGIDVGFIYDADHFTAEAQFSHVVMRRTATRDILQVNFRTQHDRLLVVVCNHWPSRRGGGKSESAGYRIIAGETMAYFHQRVMEIYGGETAFLAMGDFNDEPFDPSLVDYALSTRSLTKVLRTTSVPRLLNLMWPLMEEGMSSYYYDNFPNFFDQFLANKNLIKEDSPIRVLHDTIQVLRVAEMIKDGDYPTPIPFGGMGKEVNQTGYSDHYPITVTVREED